uniref:roquin-2 isoform X2 n=1 Tax=Doryrhamphus excisus TaxID=161450 RepID=UPI0025AE06C1|nr:roquin-2 isoform X2 [Doryrhamphus excisus]
MPVQAAQWTEFLSCPICYNDFDSSGHQPVSLGCSHTVCRACLHKLHRKACPFDQTPISTDIDLLPVNCALLQLLGSRLPDVPPVSLGSAADVGHYDACRACVEDMALYLKPISGAKGVAPSSPSALSRPMQRKLVTLVNCQLVEEEGRLRAVRAGRSLGERTVTELILQHQNPQQLSANLWAAVRARGCQFLGPAMQEDALKLVLLALEDGSALSRKVLVLFVVQKLEGRFPQASKTSIGHVVQLLYRASCFKVTKRDEDSSLMQLKEEFRTYEALRREHDAQIVHIAMEAGLRISPEQWSSLLYGDLVHKSHMQSIIDKLQTPESFAKSVQELTIVLQRTGDPANLSGLRPHLHLLANIDHNPEDPAPSWQEVERVMLAVKLVVQGLVEFIHKFSKKTQDSPQPQVNSKYKTSMCRDLRHQGGCPRGSNCTFAHTQDELEKFRLRNKKSSSVSRAIPLPSAKTFVMEGGGIAEGSAGDYSMKRVTSSESMGASGASGPSSGTVLGSAEQKSVSPPPAPPVSHSTASSPLGTADGASKHGPLVLRVTHPSQDLIYQEAQSAYDTAHFHTSCSFYPHKPCMARFLRSANVPESSMPPSSFPADPSSSSSSSPSGYPPPPPGDRLGPPVFHPHPGQPQYGALASAHGVYAPLYDSRRVWRPQLYHREDARSNSLPPEVLHSSVYQPPLRERFNSLDSNYCSGSEHRAGPHGDYTRVPLGYDQLFRRKQEQWAHHHHHHHHHQHHQHGANRPSQSSAIFNMDFGAEHADSGVGPCVGCRFRGEESLARYSPWSCGGVGPCLRPFEPETLQHAAPHSCLEQTELDSGVTKRWLHSLEQYRRLKEEDPIIPFSEGPIISKWGAISRASRSGYHTTDPVQATACQGGTSTTPVNFKDYNSHGDHSESRWISRGSVHAPHDSEQLCAPDLRQHPSSERKAGFSQDQHHREPRTGRDIDLELCHLDLEDPNGQEMKESADLAASYSEDAAHPHPPPAEEQRHADSSSTDKMDAHLLKKMAFRKSLSPVGLVSGGLGKLVLRTGTPGPGGDSAGRSGPEEAGAEMLLGGS